MASIGDNIRKFRKKVNLSQEKVSIAAGLHRKSIWFYESGRREVPSQYMKAIADALGVTVEMLLEEEEKDESLEQKLLVAILGVLKEYEVVKK